MRKDVAFPLAVKTAKLTTIFLLAGVAAGCSSELTRFSESPFSNPFAQSSDQVVTGSLGSQPQRVRTSQPQMVRPQPVQVRGPQVSPLAGVPRQPGLLPAPAPVAHLVPTPPAIRSNASDLSSMATGAATTAVAGTYQGWSAKGGIPFTLGETDSVSSISRRFGIPVPALLAVNGLASPAEAVPGTKLILPVLNGASAKASPAIVPGGLKPLSDAGKPSQPEFLFQSGAPFATRAALIPRETRSDVVLANADDSEAAILRRKLKKLQEEVDALEASESRRKSAAKPVRTKTVDAEDTPISVKPVLKKKAEAPVTDADAPPKFKAPKRTATTEASSVVLGEASSLPKKAPKPKLAEAEAAAKSNPVRRKVDNAEVAPKTSSVKTAGTKTAATKTTTAKDGSAKSKLASGTDGKAKLASKTNAKAAGEKTTLAEKVQPKKPKTEQVAKTEAKPKVPAKPARIISTAEAKAAEPNETVATVDAADDNLTTGKVSLAPVVQADPGFRWPARGRIIQGFDGTGNRGVKIAVPEGTPVKSAGAGKVIYVGEEVKGYGKLVLVRHLDGYVSAYGNNSELLVKRGEEVGRGQELARSGSSGDVSSPMLHFELRKGAQAVDPLTYLK